MLTSPKQFALAPLYLRQAYRIKRDTPSLPEAIGNRQGVLRFVSNKKNSDNPHHLSSHQDEGIQDKNTQDKDTQKKGTQKKGTQDKHKQTPSSADDCQLTNDGHIADSSIVEVDGSTTITKNPLYRLMIVGDSSAAGVGVDYQSQALMGRLLLALSQNDSFTDRHSAIDWQLHATTGHTSFDVLRRLYVIPTPPQPLDTMVIVVGVNDITQLTTNTQMMASWDNNINEIIRVAKQKFQPKSIIFSALPPVTHFPTLPYPLNELIGDKAVTINKALAEICLAYDSVHHIEFAFPFDPKAYSANFIRDRRTAIAKYFAIDGFHPGALAYKTWGEQMAEFVVTLD